MAQMQFTIPNFNQSSRWTSYFLAGVVTHTTPSTDTDTKTVDISSIPAGSTISSASISASYNSPLSGASIRTIEGSPNFTGSKDITSKLQGLGGSYSTISFEFKFKAYGGTGSSSYDGTPHESSLNWSDITVSVTYTPPYTAPSVTNVKLAGSGSDQFRSPGTTVPLSWTGVNGAHNSIQSYTISRSADGTNYTQLAQGVTGTSYDVTAHTAGGSYYVYKVAAVGEYGSSALAVSPKLYSYTAPAVSAVKLNGSTSNQYMASSASVLLSWTGTNGSYNAIQCYTVKYSINGGAYSPLTTVTGTSVSVTAPGSTSEYYQYQITAAGQYSSSGAVLSSKLYTFTNPGVSGVTLAGSASDQYRAPGAAVTLSWTGSSGINNIIQSYTISRSSDGTNYTELATGLTGTSHNVIAHAAGGSYYKYKVVAVGAYGGSADAYSPRLYSYTAPTAPDTVHATPLEVAPGGSATLTWSGAAAPGGVSIASYAIWRAASPGGTYAQVGTSTTTAWAFTAPNGTGHHYHKVQAIGSVAGYYSGLSLQYADLYVRQPHSTFTLDRTRVPMDGVTAITATLHVNDPTYTHVLRWYMDATHTISHEMTAGDTSDSCVFPLEWNAIVPATSTSAYAELTTKWGSTVIGTQVVPFTAEVPESVKPAATLAPTLNNVFLTYALSGYTTVTLNLTATFPDGTTPHATEAYRIWGGGSYDVSSQTLVAGPFSAGSYTFYGRAKDSRPRQGTDEYPLTVTSYTPPAISMVDCFRANTNNERSNEGTRIRVKATFHVTSLDGNNSAAEATVRYKKSGTSNWLGSVSMISGVETTLADGIDTDKCYDVQINLKDTVGKDATPYPVSVPASVRLFDFRNDRAALGRLAPKDTGKVLALPDDWDILHKGQTLDARFLQTPILLGSGTNLNDIQTPGMYYCPANATVATFINCPTGYALALLVERTAGCVQTVKEYRTDSAAKVFIRRYYSGTWGAWAQVWDSNAAIPKANVQPPAPADIGAAVEGHTHTPASLGAVATTGDQSMGGKLTLPRIRLTATTDAAGASNNDVALMIGSDTGTHIIMDNNEIMAKSNSTTPSTLYLNGDGGLVQVGAGGFVSVGAISEQGTSLASKYAASGHTHSYLPLSGGAMTGNLQINTSGKYYQIGCQNNSYAHHNTDATYGHWFNKDVRVAGNMYAGTNYDQLVLHLGNWTSYCIQSGNRDHHQVTGLSDTFTNWNSGLKTAFYSPGTLTNQPSSYGNILSIGNGGEISQLWATQASGAWYHRQANGSGWSTGWKRFHDEDTIQHGTAGTVPSLPDGYIYIKHS